jgi:hypothetical protein
VLRSFNILLALALLALAACSGTRRPVLYPNDHYKAVGATAANRDINECRRLARQLGATSNAGAGVAKSTAGGALVGGAAGGALGAVRRNDDAGQRAAEGAAVGGAVGLARGVLKGDQSGSVHEKFVNRCLKGRGYEVIGWN